MILDDARANCFVKEYLEATVHAIRQNTTAVSTVESTNSLGMENLPRRVERSLVVRIVDHPVTYNHNLSPGLRSVILPSIIRDLITSSGT